MKIQTSLLKPILLGCGMTLAASCGSVSQSGNTQKTATSANSATSANLADDAAAAEATADTTAAASDAGSDSSTTASEEDGIPNFLKAIEAARAYTKSLLGISDAPLKEFKAAVEAARALATDRDDFKSKIEPAEATFKAALEAQKTAAEAARVTNKTVLDAIFVATEAVFLQCSADVGLMQHQGRERNDRRQPPRPRDGRGPEMGSDDSGSGSDDGSGSAALADSGSDVSSDSDGPRIVFGGGEFRGSMSDLEQKAKAGHKSRQGGRHEQEGQGPGPDGDGSGSGSSDASDSAECTAAVSALNALIPSGT